MTSSVSLFPLTYLGYSVIQRSNHCELETIYELLMEYYLQFLKNVMTQPSCLTPFKNSMSKSYETVVLAIGNGSFTIRTLNINLDKGTKLKNQMEEKFNAQDLLYFNCYYLEVVTPVGRDKETCYAYFRRVVDARRYVPEEALIRLDRKMSNWLLRHRCLMRPPLIYCIVPRAGSIRSLACFVFLAETTQIGLKIVRCFSELRYTSNIDRSILEENYNDRGNINSRKHTNSSVIKSRIDCPIPAQVDNKLFKMYHVDQKKTSFDDNYCDSKVDYGKPCLSARAARSHNDLIMAFDRINLDDQCKCDANREFLLNPINSCPIHAKSFEKYRARLLQMRLGHEALDFYRQRQRGSSADRVMKKHVARDRSVPDILRHECSTDSNDYFTHCCPECKANVKERYIACSPHQVRRHDRRQQKRQQPQNQYQSELNEICKFCFPNDRSKLLSNRDKCHCHAHLGGSLELIP